MDTVVLMLGQQGDSKACIVIFFCLFFFYLDIMLSLATTHLQSLVCGFFLSYRVTVLFLQGEYQVSLEFHGKEKFKI